MSRGKLPAVSLLVLLVALAFLGIRPAAAVTPPNPGDIIVTDGAGVVRQSPSGGAPTTIFSGSPYHLPVGVAVDASGSIIIVEPRNGVFRQSPNGGMPTAIFTGAPYRAPSGAAIDASGNIIVTDIGPRGVFRQSPSGGAPTLIFSGSPYIWPQGVAIDTAGNIIVADLMARGVFRQSPSGGAPTTIFSGAPYQIPSSVAVDASGNIIVADQSVPGVFRQSPDGSAPTTIFTGAPYSAPFAVAIDASGNIIVADQSVPGVFRQSPNGGAPTLISDAYVNPHFDAVYPFVTAGGSVSLISNAANLGGSMSSLSSVSVESISPSPPSGLTFPYGLLSFTATGLGAGQTLTVQLLLSSPLPPGSFGYWKLQSDAWTQLPSNQVSINALRNVVTLTLTADATGTVTDPGGPAIGTTIIPEYPIGLPLLAVFMLVAYGLIRRRTKTPKNF